MEFIPALFLLLQIFSRFFSGVKLTNEFCYLVQDNPGYGIAAINSVTQPENPEGLSFAQEMWEETMDKTVTAAEAVKNLTKKLLVEVQLETELRESMLVVKREKKRLQTTKANAATLKEEVKHSRDQVKALTEAVKNAQAELSTRAQVLAETRKKVLDTRQSVDEKKKRIELLSRRVEMARADFENTKIAVEEAARKREEEMQAELEKLFESEMKAETEAS
ncbi:tropomyosin [Drosophila kikkawai]|uniref:Tropomyosin n=1 Tax=Drosophila kikkawai TaxID=30033 RepID=A0A6P4JMA0_DROKI|nr:uncharacterized protein LOC108084921 [Drosophila kikkawai]KAH8338544.1 hypothetical protein KR059_009020 [Drosophila kikkawai]